jgi:hypothetical protein
MENSLKALNASPKRAPARVAKFDENEPLTGGGEGKMHRLLEYNTYRQSILIQLPQIEKPAPINKSEADKITDAMKMKTHFYTGNLNISLFWEDIF